MDPAAEARLVSCGDVATVQVQPECGARTQARSLFHLEDFASGPPQLPAHPPVAPWVTLFHVSERPREQIAEPHRDPGRPTHARSAMNDYPINVPPHLGEPHDRLRVLCIEEGVVRMVDRFGNVAEADAED